MDSARQLRSGLGLRVKLDSVFVHCKLRSWCKVCVRGQSCIVCESDYLHSVNISDAGHYSISKHARSPSI